MKWATVFWILVATTLIVVYEWPKMNKDQKKEKRAFVIFTISGVLLAILLIYFPEIPGPTQLVEGIFKPFGKLMEK